MFSSPQCRQNPFNVTIPARKGGYPSYILDYFDLCVEFSYGKVPEVLRISTEDEQLP